MSWRIFHTKRLLSVGWETKSVGGLMLEKLSFLYLSNHLRFITLQRKRWFMEGAQKNVILHTMRATEK